MTPRRWLAVPVVLLVAADWASKFWITNRIALGQDWSLVDGWLYFAHRRNRGVAFSMLADLPSGWGTALLVGFGLVAVGVLTWMCLATHDRWVRVGSALTLAGAVGNLGDRIINGGVTDFILFVPFPYVFNVADAAITVGAVLLAICSVFGDGARPAPSPQP